MAVDDVYILALRSTLNGVQCVNTFATRRKVAAEPGVAEFAPMAQQIAGWLATHQVDDLTYTDWRATKVRGTGVTYNTTPPFRVSTVSFSGGYSPAVAGALTSPPEPGNVAIVVALNTAQSGRRRRGRIFMPGISELYIDDNGSLNDTQRNTVQTLFNTFFAAYGVGGSNPGFEVGVWSDRIATNTAYSNTWPRVLTSQGAPDPTNAYLGLASFTVRDYVGSQRDRRVGI